MKNLIEEYDRAKFNIIRKLYAKKKFNKGHLLYERLERTLPSHLRGLAKAVLKDLIKEGPLSGTEEQNMVMPFS